MWTAKPAGLRVPPLLGGLLLALDAALAAYLLAGGAGPDGQWAGALIAAATVTSLAIATTARSRGSAMRGVAMPLGTSPAATAPWTTAGSARLAPLPSLPGSRSAGARFKGSARTRGSAMGSLQRLAPSGSPPDGATPRLMVALGTIGALTFATAMSSSPGEPMAATIDWAYVVASAIIGGIPCALGGLVAGWRHRGRHGASLKGVLQGVVVGSVLSIVLFGASLDPTHGATPYLQIGILLVMAPAATIGFGLGLIVALGVARLGRLVRPAA